MEHTVVPIRYDNSREREFQLALKERVAEYLRAQPKGRLANGFMWFKVVLFAGAYAAVWASVALAKQPAMVAVPLLVLLASLSVSLAYTVAHDAVHDALSEKPWVNQALFYLTFNLLGPSAYLWREKHIVMHHSCVNIPGWDHNIEAGAILRLAPTQEWRWFHRFQHLYAPLAYVLFTLDWIFLKDFKTFFMKSIGNVTEIRHSPWRFLELVLWKLHYVAVMLVLPVVVTGYSISEVALGFLLYQFVGSFLFVITFAGSHLNEGMVFVEAGEDNRIPHSFLEHALRTSLDFNPYSKAMAFVLGGFNTHVAHHMFAHVCSVHYPALTRIIEATAKEYGLPYQHISVEKLFVRHFKCLAALGKDPASPRATYLLGAS